MERPLRIDQRNAIGPRQLDGKAGGHQHPLHGLDRQRRIQHRTQVGRSGTRRRVSGHLCPRIQHFIVYGDIFHSILHSCLPAFAEPGIF